MLQVAQVLVGDASDWNVVDADLLLSNQVQQQVERALEFTHDDLEIVTVTIGHKLRR